MQATTTLPQRPAAETIPLAAADARKEQEPLERLGHCEGWAPFVRLLLWATRNGTGPCKL